MREALLEAEGGVDVEAGDAQDLIAQGTKHLAAADVQDCGLELRSRSCDLATFGCMVYRPSR